MKCSQFLEIATQFDTSVWIAEEGGPKRKVNYRLGHCSSETIERLTFFLVTSSLAEKTQARGYGWQRRVWRSASRAHACYPTPANASERQYRTWCNSPSRFKRGRTPKKKTYKASLGCTSGRYLDHGYLDHGSTVVFPSFVFYILCC